MLKNFPTSFGFQTITIVALLSLSSCFGNNNAPSQIRIVDLNGNPKPIKRYVPEGNAKILASQNPNSFQDINNPEVAQPFRNDGVNATSNAVVDENLPNTANVNPATQANPIPPQIAPEPKSPSTAPSANVSEENISYDMSGSQIQEIKPASDNSKQTTSGKKFKFSAGAGNKSPSKTTAESLKTLPAQNGIFVQIGSYLASESANQVLHNNKKISKGKIEEINLTNGKTTYRVLLGPIANKQKAHKILKQAKNAGYKDAFIVR